MNIDKEFTEVLNILETDFGWVDTKNMEENNKESLKEFMTVVKKLTIPVVSDTFSADDMRIAFEDGEHYGKGGDALIFDIENYR